MKSTWNRHLLQYPWLILTNQLLGLIVLSEWYSLLYAGFFTPQGFVARITMLTHKSHTNLFNDAILAVANNMPWLCYIIAIVLALTAVAVLLRLYRYISNWVLVAIFACYYISHLTYPGTWLFAYAAPLAFSIIIALASCKDYLLTTAALRKLGFHIPDLWPKQLGLLAGLILSVAVSYIIILSDNSGSASTKVGLWVGATFCILFIISELMNNKRTHFQSIKKQKLSYTQWIDHNWMDYLLLTIGLILVTQVDMDYYLNWFSVKGYQGLILTYYHYSHVPHFIRHFLAVTAHWGAIFAPAQNAIESFLAIGAILLLYRFPIALGIFALCAMLTFIEFGVPSTWPVVPHGELTWTWELLSITCVAAIITAYQLTCFYHWSDTASRCLGCGIWTRVSWSKSVIIAAGLAILIGLIIFLSGSLKTLNHIFIIKSSLSCFLLLCLTIAIDRVRAKKSFDQGP